MICLVSGWLKSGLAGLWVFCGWFSWFVGSLDGLWGGLTSLWVVSSFTAYVCCEPFDSL